MLQVITRQEAERRIRERIPVKKDCVLLFPPQTEADADMISPEDLPPRSRSVVDGYAVHASDTYGCSEAIPAMLEYDGAIAMGEIPAGNLAKGRCMAIPTGGFLPEGADAVCMVEYTEDPGDLFRYILKPVAVSENVNRQGDDCRQGDVLVRQGQRITSRNIALMAAVGIRDVRDLLQRYRPAEQASAQAFRLGILSTGDELVEYDEQPRAGQIRNINAVMLAAAARELGLLPEIYPIVPDRLDLLDAAVAQAVSSCDAVLISGGTSVGEKDHVYQVLSTRGEVVFHGLALKPGKPAMFAMVRDIPVFSLPGHPMAAYQVFHLLVRPALLQMTGRIRKDEEMPEQTIRAVISRKLSSNNGREEVIPVRLEDGKAVPLRAASGVVSVLAEADGYIIIGRNTEGLQDGEEVEVYPYEI